MLRCNGAQYRSNHTSSSPSNGATHPIMLAIVRSTHASDLVTLTAPNPQHPCASRDLLLDKLVHELHRHHQAVPGTMMSRGAQAPRETKLSITEGVERRSSGGHASRAPRTFQQTGVPVSLSIDTVASNSPPMGEPGPASRRKLQGRFCGLGHHTWQHQWRHIFSAPSWPCSSALRGSLIRCQRYGQVRLWSGQGGDAGAVGDADAGAAASYLWLQEGRCWSATCRATT